MRWSLFVFGLLGLLGSRLVSNVYHRLSNSWVKPLYEFVGKTDDHMLHIWISHINETLWGIDALNLDYSYVTNTTSSYGRAIESLSALNSTFHTASPHQLMVAYLNVSHFGDLTHEQAADDQYLCNALLGEMAKYVPDCEGRVIHNDSSKKILACDIGFEPTEGCKKFGNDKDRVYVYEGGFEPEAGCRVIGDVRSRPGLTNEQWDEIQT